MQVAKTQRLIKLHYIAYNSIRLHCNNLPLFIWTAHVRIARPLNSKGNGRRGIWTEWSRHWNARHNYFLVVQKSDLLLFLRSVPAHLLYACTVLLREVQAVPAVLQDCRYRSKHVHCTPNSYWSLTLAAQFTGHITSTTYTQHLS
jgi:hypothetical protein